jgi:hypothetical protein
VQWIRRRRLAGRAAFGLLAIQWAWSGAVYQWVYFRAINPAAVLFGAGFVVQAALFVWLATTSRAQVLGKRNQRTGLAGALVGCALLYPLLGLSFGLQYPRVPLFAVLCPATLLTAGWLVAAVGVPRVVNIVPLLWAVIGTSAAFALGIRADPALAAAAVILAIDTVAPSLLGSRAQN